MEPVEEKNVGITEVLENISEMKRVNCDDVQKLEEKITGEEVSSTLMQKRNNVAPGPGGFGGGFYKVFWKYFKNIVVCTINEIYEEGALPLPLSLGIIALIPKGDKDQRYISNW